VVNHQAETDFMMRAAALEIGEDAVGEANWSWPATI